MTRDPQASMGSDGHGQVVYLVERGALLAARVVAVDGARRVIELVGGGSAPFAVALGRLYWLSDGRVASASELADYWATVQRRLPATPLATAWAAVMRGGHAAGPCRARDVALALGWPGDPADADAVALATFRDGTHLKVKERVLWLESVAEVEAAEARREAKARTERKLALAHAGLLGRLRGTVLAAADVSDEARAALGDALAALRDVAIHGRDAARLAEAEALLARLGRPAQKDSRELQIAVENLLVELGELAPFAHLAPERAGLSLVFPPEVLLEAERSASRFPGVSAVERDDLRVLTIDDPETTEIDDGVALDPRAPARLIVLIADPAAYVAPGSLVDREAAQRGATLYAPSGKVPMLPPTLGEGAASLVTGEVRLALAFSFEVAPGGHVTGVELQRVKVKVARHLSYEEADALLAEKDPTGDAALLQRVRALIDRHRAWRHSAGAVTFQRPEVYYHEAEDGTVEVKVGDPLGPGRQLVAELMVATCAAVAELCVSQAIPCLYRAQAAPDQPPPPPDPVTGRIDDPALQHEILRKLKPSTLGTRADPHWTLGVSAYVQMTSPLRRYADLVVHQQLAAWLQTGRPRYTAGELDAIAGEAQKRAGLVRRVEFDLRRVAALRWLAAHPEVVLDGVILREVGRRSLVELMPIGMQELVTLRRPRARRMPGGAERVRLRVVSVDPRRDQVELKEV